MKNLFHVEKDLKSTCSKGTMPKNYYYDMSVFKRWFDRKRKRKWTGHLK